MIVRVFVFLLAGGLAVPAAAQESAQAQSNKKDDSYVATYEQLPDTPLDQPQGEDPKARVEWMRERFAGTPGPEFTRMVLDAIVKDQAANPAAFRWNGSIAPGTPGHWFSIGPVRSNWIRNGVRVTASDTGRLRAILVHPTNGDIVYLLTSSGGLWKTTNFTSPRPSWTPLTDGVGTSNGGSIAFGSDPDTLYYGTGDPFDIGVGGVMFTSTDGGASWGDPAFLGTSTYVTDVKVESVPNGNDIVLVGTSAGLSRSADGGASYSQVAGGAGQPFAGKRVWSLARTKAGWLAAAEDAARYGSIYLSTDNGATWNEVGTSVFRAARAEISRTSLGVGVPGDEVVYAFANGFTYTEDGAREFFQQQDLYRSTDGGVNWTPLNLKSKQPANPTSYQPDLNVMADQPTYNQMILVDPTDPDRNTVYLGGQFASVKTTDGGATWRVIADWLALDKMPYVHADYHAAAFSNAGGRKTLLFGTDGGLFVSTDGGVSFSDQKNDGIGSYMVYAMTSSGRRPDDILIGLQDNGTRLRFGRTATYNQVYGGDGFGVGWSQAGADVAIGSLYYSRMFRSTNNPPATQEKWLFGSTGIAETNNPSTSYFVTSVTTPTATADPTGLVFFTRTRNKVYKTSNGAASWTKFWESPQTVIGKDPEGNPIMGYTRTVRAGSHGVGVSPEGVDHVAILLNGALMVQTTDGGETWTESNLSAEVPGYPGFNATVAYASNDVLYVGNESPASAPIRVIKSIDGGDTWTASASGLPDVPVTRLLVSTKEPNTIFAATWVGVYRSTNAGGSWERYGSGLPYAVISDLYMAPDGSFLRASSYGRGVWEIR
jgi:photosystem II stability/assembly factor-like uncharacterized protein